MFAALHDVDDIEGLIERLITIKLHKPPGQ